MLRLMTAGESHGEYLLAILDGMPAGLQVKRDKINEELSRRQGGIGRGARMAIEKDEVFSLAGVINGFSIGAPIGIIVKNRDSALKTKPGLPVPRPGHADLSGMLKFHFNDARQVLERASARETVCRVAAGAICKMFLNEFGINISSKVIHIAGELSQKDILKAVEKAKKAKDTLGGVFQVVIKGVIPGLGSYRQFDTRLDAKLALAITSIPAIKGVEIGMGFGSALLRGSQVHDPIILKDNKLLRKSNNAGGIEGGLTNGEDILIKAAMKPIATLAAPLDSVNLTTRKKSKAPFERSDTCAVHAAGIIAENMAAFVLADVFMEKFGQDCLKDIKTAFINYKNKIG